MNTAKTAWINELNYINSRENKLELTDTQINWFGERVAAIRENTDYPEPCGTECRVYPRAFLNILEDRNVIVESMNALMQPNIGAIESQFAWAVTEIATMGINELIGNMKVKEV